MRSIADIIAILISLVVPTAGLYWIAYRHGYRNGLATWRKSYRYMTAKEIAEHKTIINQLAETR